MKIKEVLIKNGFERYLSVVSDEILSRDAEICDKVCETELYDGIKLYNSNDKSLELNISTDEPIWTDESEFTPFCIMKFDEKGYIICEEGYTESLELVYRNVDY